MRAADVQLAAVAGAEQLPVGSLRRSLCRHGHDAHGVPELGECAQDGGLGDLATEARAQLDGGEGAFAFEQLVGFGGQRRDAGTADRRRGTLGIALRLHRVEVRESFGRREKIRVLADETRDTDARRGPEEIERDDGAGGDEAREHLRCGGDMLRAWRCIGTTGDRFDEAGRGHGQMLPAREIEAQRRVGEPALRVVECDERVAVLTPACSPRLFQLVLSHDYGLGLPILISSLGFFFRGREECGPLECT
jgi:hypothetical protein